ncbi:MAG TPA: hypothetical protein ACFE0H_16190 [Elainellaceae cyanobacterium]
MSTMTLAQKNVSATESQPWLTSSVQTFFSVFNWDNVPIQPVELSTSLAATNSQKAPPSMIASVSQFFDLIPWEGTRVIAAPAQIEVPLLSVEADDFTLDDLSGLF